MSSYFEIDDRDPTDRVMHPEDNLVATSLRIIKGNLNTKIEDCIKILEYKSLKVRAILTLHIEETGKV